MISVYKVFLLFILVALTACSERDETATEEKRDPRCEKRNNTDPARLNIDSDAMDYGLIKPCHSTINFYIAKNTELRTISGRVNLLVEDIKLNAYEFEIDLNRPEGGLLFYNFDIPAQDNYRCNEISLNIDALQCFNESSRKITCPAIRVKKTMILSDLQINAKMLDVCFDD